MLQKSLFSCLLCREPVTENMATEAYKRELEINNLVTLMNTFDELALHAWNPKAGPNDENQRRLSRIVGSKSMMAWSEILRDAICAKIDLHDSDDKARPFYRELSDSDLQRIRAVVARLVGWKRWEAPANDEIDRILSGNKGDVKAWMKDKNLTTGYSWELLSEGRRQFPQNDRAIPRLAHQVRARHHAQGQGTQRRSRPPADAHVDHVPEVSR